MDWVSFLDIFVELYGDPFFERRYSELFRLIDADHVNALLDEDLVPLLRAAGLDSAQATEALTRLLGNSLTLDSRQFAASLFEAELTGAKFPAALKRMAQAYLNIDCDSRGCGRCPCPCPCPGYKRGPVKECWPQERG